MTAAAPATATATPAAVNPYASLALGGVSAVTSIIGLIMQKQATDKAAKEAKAIDTREVAYRAGRDVVNDRFSKENLKLQKDQAALNKSLAMHGLNADKIAQVENMFNTNTALQDRTLKLWSQ
jgi:hypothetical protein